MGRRRKPDLVLKCPKCGEKSEGVLQGNWFVHPAKCPHCKVSYTIGYDESTKSTQPPQ
jgi:hypothetical protein